MDYSVALWRRAQKGIPMLSDLLSYMVLASTFVVIGLRMFVDKPNKLSEILSLRFVRKRPDENSAPAQVD